MAESSGDVWLHCSACRKDISFGKIHWVCSVSTCNRARMQLVFCSVSCWDSHVATLRHRDAWAVEARAPSHADAAAGCGGAITSHAEAAIPSPRSEEPTLPLPRGGDGPSSLVRVAPLVAVTPLAATVPLLSTAFERDMLVVVSKLKKYIRDRSGMNTSDAVAEVLGEHLRLICDEAIAAAAADGRKTVLDRDVPRPRR